MSNAPLKSIHQAMHCWGSIHLLGAIGECGEGLNDIPCACVGAITGEKQDRQGGEGNGGGITKRATAHRRRVRAWLVTAMQITRQEGDKENERTNGANITIRLASSISYRPSHSWLMVS